jgi:hypothetical protein
MAETKTYSGACHCGKVTYEVDLVLEHAMSCNCSICRKRGLLLAFAPAEQFRLLSGEGHLQDYRFNTGKIAHLFCRTCGVESFGQGEVPGTGAQMRAINLRCVEGVDLDTLPVRKFDGASL